jgi:hypothetical protein
VAGQNVLVDAQFGMARILKPFPNFEARYQGQPASVPIAFPGTIDREAELGVQGFDPNLIAGIPVPIGARVMIWIPSALIDYFVPTPYQYQIIWRLRSIGDFVDAFNQNVPKDQMPYYHLRRRELGVANDPADPASRRVVIPGAIQTIAYEQPEPSTSVFVNANGVIHLRGQLIIPLGAEGFDNVTGSNLWQGPFLPPPRPGPPEIGIITQGVFPFVEGPTAPDFNGGIPGGPVYHPFWFDAEGDEMLIFARRVDVDVSDPNDTWDFANPDLDQSFSNTFGTNNGTRQPIETVGIFVFTGTAP